MKSSAKRYRTDRRGSVYLAVLGVAVIVSMTSLCALHLVRIDRRAVTARANMARARFAAQSAVEFAVARIDADSSWRNNYTHATNALDDPISIGLAQFNFQLRDDDGKLADDTSDPVGIRGRGVSGSAVFVYEAEAEPASGTMRIVPGSWQRVADE